MRKVRSPSANLEREVIVSVVILYLLICAAMLGIHYWQPAGTETTTSSMSPSHEELKAKPTVSDTPATVVAPRDPPVAAR